MSGRIVVRNAGIEIEGLVSVDAESVGRVIMGVREILGCGLLGVEVCGISSREARSLNRKYRGKDKTATVLSFSLPSTHPGGMAGQVLLCSSAVRREAGQLGIPYRVWLAELSVHGFLHILGYRHNEAPYEDIMFSCQRALLHLLRKV